jgi:hypothetical protein
LRYNAVRPDFAANWQLRVQVQFLFPKLPRQRGGREVAQNGKTAARGTS